MIDFWDSAGVLEFSGPDAVRFLNGQLTQDVRLVVSSEIPLAACVTDAKGKLMFRVWLAASEKPGAVLVFCPANQIEALESRLTRYLIADEVEVADVSHATDLHTFTFPHADISEVERIQRGIPKWGAELKEGMLPPEAGLDASDISYAKGCYIGQEVISRIKSAGKVNRYLTKFAFEKPVNLGEIKDHEGKIRGEITSISGLIGLGYLKRGVEAGQALYAGDSPVKVRH